MTKYVPRLQEQDAPVLLISFFAYFLNIIQSMATYSYGTTHGFRLVRSSLSHPKKREDLDQYPSYYPDGRIHHFRSRRYFRVYLKTSEEAFNALKDPDECILASPSILSRL